MTLAIAPDIDVKLWQDCHSRWQTQAQRVCRLEPEALLVPHNQAALSKLVREAQSQQKRIIPCGHGTKLAWGGVTKKVDWLVSAQRLNRILDHAVDDLTITVEAGLTLRELQAHLDQYQQFLPIDPAFPGEATIGGMVFS